MEAAEVDQGVGAEEEVGDDGSDGVQLSWWRDEGGESIVVTPVRVSGLCLTLFFQQVHVIGCVL